MNTKIQKTKIFFSQRISVKVTLLILIILSIGIGGTILYYSISQNTILVDIICTLKENAGGDSTKQSFSRG